MKRMEERRHYSYSQAQSEQTAALKDIVPRGCLFPFAGC
jgi:hypothetical protein